MDMKLQMVDLHGQYLKIKKEVDTGVLVASIKVPKSYLKAIND
jgi:hypothetical protein